jgi:hypothetical protein
MPLETRYDPRRLGTWPVPASSEFRIPVLPAFFP